jgi:hypothetical protein
MTAPRKGPYREGSAHGAPQHVTSPAGAGEALYLKVYPLGSVVMNLQLHFDVKAIRMILSAVG